MNLTVQNFLSDASEHPDVRFSLDIYPSRSSEREPVRILLLGSQQGVNTIIHTLHHLRFAEVFEWSRDLPAPMHPITARPGEVMKILTKHIPML